MRTRLEVQVTHTHVPPQTPYTPSAMLDVPTDQPVESAPISHPTINHGSAFAGCHQNLYREGWVCVRGVDALFRTPYRMHR